MFIGTTTNNRDAKGRVSVPADFRNVITQQSAGLISQGFSAFDGIVVWPSVQGDCLEGAGERYLAGLQESMDDFDVYDDTAHALLHRIFGESRRLSFDSGGRVSLPNDLADHAQLNGRIQFVGLGRRFEIWNPDIFEQNAEARRQLAFDNRHRLKPAPKLGGNSPLRGGVS